MKATYESPILELLKQIEEKHFGPIEDLDQGEDVSDADLLNGFMNAYHAEDSDAEDDEAKQPPASLRSTWFYYFLLAVLFTAIVLEILKTLSYWK